jgi:hypothetical protein
LKFLKNYNFRGVNLCYDDFYLDLQFDFDFDKYNIKNRKNLNNIKPGVSDNLKKNSIKRDKNNSLIFQFLNINTKKGKKFLIYKSINNMLENLFFSLKNNCNEFETYKNYKNVVFLYNNTFEYSDMDNLLHNMVSDLESIFEIKTKKNNKKLKLKDKYTHEIVYIPKERRLKYVLRSLSLYKESFKNYIL